MMYCFMWYVCGCNDEWVTMHVYLHGDKVGADLFVVCAILLYSVVITKTDTPHFVRPLATGGEDK